MNFELIATVSHPAFDKPVIKVMYIHGPSFDDILAQIEAIKVPPEHMHNLRFHRKCGFKDEKGVKHRWELKEQKVMNENKLSL